VHPEWTYLGRRQVVEVVVRKARAAIRGPLFCAFVLLLLGWGTAAASPNATTHQRVLLLGADDSTYYTLVIRSVNPGSYHRHTDSVYLDQNGLSGTRLERHLVRVVERVDPTVDGEWGTTDLFAPPMNVEAYLAQREVDYATSGGPFLSVRASQRKLWVMSEGDSAEIADLGTGGLSPNDLEDCGNLNVVLDHYPIFACVTRDRRPELFELIHVRIGCAASDMSSTEMIVPVAMTRLNAERDAMERRRRRR
jgi:hypothetical protein